MRAMGVVRKLDHLGRLVLPIELRRTLDIDTQDEIEILVDEEGICLRKYEPKCIFCEGTDVILFKEKLICRKCLHDLSS